MNSRIKVISLDLDGVLYDGHYAAIAVAEQLGLGNQFAELIQRMQDEGMSLRESVVEGSKLWKGVAVDKSYDYLVDSLPLMRGANETVTSLKNWGYEVGCISSGVSQFFMAPFKRRLNLDFTYSNTLGSTDGVHDGRTEYIMDGPEKAARILKHIEDNGYSKDCIASVGNGTNDIDLFKISAFSIAYNPLFKTVSDAASVTINSKDLRSILPYFERS